MDLTKSEKKILLLAMDRSAPDGEITAAAGRQVRLFRKRYRNGYELIGDFGFIAESHAETRFAGQTICLAATAHNVRTGHTPFWQISRQTA